MSGLLRWLLGKKRTLPQLMDLEKQLKEDIGELENAVQKQYFLAGRAYSENDEKTMKAHIKKKNEFVSQHTKLCQQLERVQAERKKSEEHEFRHLTWEEILAYGSSTNKRRPLSSTVATNRSKQDVEAGLPRSSRASTSGTIPGLPGLELVQGMLSKCEEEEDSADSMANFLEMTESESSLEPLDTSEETHWSDLSLETEVKAVCSKLVIDVESLEKLAKENESNANANEDGNTSETDSTSTGKTTIAVSAEQEP